MTTRNYGGKLRVNITISPTVKDWYEARAQKTGMSMSALMSYALNDYITKRDPECSEKIPLVDK